MSRASVLVLAATMALAPGLAAQDNPFKLATTGTPAVSVSYTMSGDLTGEGAYASDGRRTVNHSRQTGKFFGRTTTTESWALTTRDSIYSADLVDRKGTVMANPMPAMARAYDALDRDAKRRLHENMAEMSTLLARAFTMSSLGLGEKTGTRTIAGERCDERAFGGFTVCDMQKAPGVPLHLSGSLLCVRYEQTATQVTLGAPPAGAFSTPEGIRWQPLQGQQSPDSVARAMIFYLSSQALADSLASAREQLKTEHASMAREQGMTPEQSDSLSQAQMQAACEAIRDFDIGSVMADVGKQLMESAAKGALEGARQGVEDAARRGVRGLIRRPQGG